jgi:hypothetical protein
MLTSNKKKFFLYSLVTAGIVLGTFYMSFLSLTKYVHRGALKTPELNCIVRNDSL